MPDRFSWYELMTPDTAASQAFYTNVVGWTPEPVGPGYTIFKPLDSDSGVAGMQLTPPSARPGWIGYIHVGDVDSYVAKVETAGGHLLKEPMDIPGMLRFAVFADPQGAPFILFTPAPIPGGQPPEPPMGTPGYIGWHELYASDWPNAFNFYAGLFGWEKDMAMDMGAMGTYQIIRPGTPGPMGAMMNDPAGQPPRWMFYFNVEAIDAAMERIGDRGGTVTMGPHEVPGGNWIVLANDPQGIPFALVAPKR